MSRCSSADFRSRMVIAMLLTMCGCTGAKQGDNSPPVMTALESMEQLKSEQAARQQAEAMKNAPSAVPEDLKLPAEPEPPQTGTYKVRFETTAGDFVVLVHRDWAPIGAEHFHKLVSSGFYDECRFFRVVPGFMVQFGMNGDPEIHRQWRTPITDESVKKTNKPGYMTFAKTGAPNSRSTQVFINYGDNSFLDDQGFSPFGEVIEGMENVKSIYAEYGERPDQSAIEASGNEYLTKSFPNLDSIKKATIVPE